MDKLQKVLEARDKVFEARDALREKIEESVGNVMDQTLTKVSAIGGGGATDEAPVLYDIVSEGGAVVHMEYDTNSPVVQRLAQLVPVSVVEWRGNRARICAPAVGWISLKDDFGRRQLARSTEARKDEVDAHFQNMFDKKFNAMKAQKKRDQQIHDPRAEETGRDRFPARDDESHSRRNRRDRSPESDRDRKPCGNRRDFSPDSPRDRNPHNRNARRARRDYSSDSDEDRNTRGSRRNQSTDSDRNSGRKSASGEIPKLNMPSMATAGANQLVQADLLDLLDLGSPIPDKENKNDSFGDSSCAKPDDEFADFFGSGQQSVPQGSVQKPVLGVIQGGMQPNLQATWNLPNGQGCWPMAQSGHVSMGLPVGPDSKHAGGVMHEQSNFAALGAQPQPSGWTMGQGQMGQMMGGSPPVYNQVAMGFPMANSTPWTASGVSGINPGHAPQMGAYAANNQGMQVFNRAC